MDPYLDLVVTKLDATIVVYVMYTSHTDDEIADACRGSNVLT